MSGSPHVLLSFLGKLPFKEYNFTVAEPAGPNHGPPIVLYAVARGIFLKFKSGYSPP